jgi:hypothetical protein
MTAGSLCSACGLYLSLADSLVHISNQPHWFTNGTICSFPPTIEAFSSLSIAPPAAAAGNAPALGPALHVNCHGTTNIVEIYVEREK